MPKKSSARFASEVARQAGNAARAAWTAASTSSDAGEVDGAGLAPPRRVEDGAAAAGGAVDAAASDPVRDPCGGGCFDRLRHVG